MAEPISVQQLKDASLDVKSLEEVVNGDENVVVTTRLGETYPSVKGSIKKVFEAGGLPAEPFATKELMVASALVDGDYAMVTDDAANNGLYVKTAGAWVESAYDPLVQAKNYTDKKTSPLVNNKDDRYVPLLVDASDNILMGYDTKDDVAVIAGLDVSKLDGMVIPDLGGNNDQQYIPVLVDSNGKILIGYDIENDKAICAGLDSTASPQQSQQIKQLTDLGKTDINHFLFYGQSLSVGATATTILSTSQPYSNLTFNTSPRMDTAATSVIPLVEQFNNPASDGSANRGETVCSGAANYATRSMMLNNNIDPDDHVIFASTAGHGGYRIDQLEKGTAWYDVFKNHVTQAMSLNTGTYKVQIVGWIQGENNAVSGGLETPYAEYKSALAQLQKDISDDVKAITLQPDDVEVITYQMSYAAATHSDITIAQLDLVRESDKFHLSTPIYHMPYATDKVHLTNVGYKWLGAYFGRAYKQRVIDNRKPDFINPLSAKIDGNTVTIKFDVPMQPLVFDSSTLAATTDNGFKVIDSLGTEINIISMSTSSDIVVLTLATTPSANVTVRYALDYLAAGLTITGGASGNLRDSTKDSVVINNITKPLYHVCPHFAITAFTDRGI